MTEMTSQVQTKLAELLQVTGFDNEPAGNYHEDDWTKRLHQCLLFNNIDSELTAPLRGPHTKESWKTQIPQDVDGNCLLFHGAQDLIIKVKDHTTEEENKNEGLISIDSQDADDETSGSAGSSPRSESSDTSGRFQIAHHMSVPYKRNSYLTEKVGQLIAALHTAVTSQALRKYAKKVKVCSLKAHGLHIHRAMGIIYVELTLSEKAIQINTQQLIDGVLSPELFCSTMSYFMGKLKKSVLELIISHSRTIIIYIYIYIYIIN